MSTITRPVASAGAEITAVDINKDRADLVNNAGDYAVTTGSANAYIAAVDSSGYSLAAGTKIRISANFSNTGAATLNVNAGGAVAIKKSNSVSALVDVESKDIISGNTYELTYDGTYWQLHNREDNVYDIITFTRLINNANGDVTYNHSLGKIPKRIDFEMSFTNSSAMWSHGSWVPDKNYCVWGAGATTGGYDTNRCIDYYDTSTRQSGYVSAVTATTFTITWVKVSTPGAVALNVLAKLIA